MKLKIIGILIILSLGYSLFYCIEKITELKKDNSRIQTNLENSDFKIDSLKTKNGELFYQYNSLIVTNKELEKINNEILEKNKELGIKVKNLESYTKIETKYIVKIDTFETTKIDNNKFQAKYKNQYIDVIQQITLTENSLENCIPIIDSLQIKITDCLSISREPIYKRRWIFWKRMIGVKEYIKSDNPYFKLDKVESYILLDKKKKSKIK